MRNGNEKCKHKYSCYTPLSLLPLDLCAIKKGNEKNLLMHLNDIPPQALEIYDFNWFGQAENSKSVVNTSGVFVLVLWAFVICPRRSFFFSWIIQYCILLAF